ncbi:hypothetical protein L1887_06099 [Cichorium endivia]|nr:hypothetical protein L1887_06099 [Cichorium endivia]
MFLLWTVGEITRNSHLSTHMIQGKFYLDGKMKMPFPVFVILITRYTIAKNRKEQRQKTQKNGLQTRHQLVKDGFSENI